MEATVKGNADGAHEPIFVRINPPGNHDNHFAVASYIFAATPKRSKISPNIMNIGMATGRNSMDVCQVISSMARCTGMRENN